MVDYRSCNRSWVSLVYAEAVAGSLFSLGAGEYSGSVRGSGASAARISAKGLFNYGVISSINETGDIGPCQCLA